MNNMAPFIRRHHFNVNKIPEKKTLNKIRWITQPNQFDHRDDRSFFFEANIDICINIWWRCFIDCELNMLIILSIKLTFFFSSFPSIQVVLWVSWFSILGFLHLISQLCKERFEYVSFFFDVSPIYHKHRLRYIFIWIPRHITVLQFFIICEIVEQNKRIARSLT